MTRKQRFAVALRHEEPDRVPTFELAFSTRLAAEALGRPAFFPRSGGLSLKKILLANMVGRSAVRELIHEGTVTQVELYRKLGYDATYLIPTEFLQPVCGSFGLFGSNYLFDVTIEPVGEETWKVSGDDEFWAVYRYAPESDAFFSVEDFISVGGIEALRRYVERLEEADPGLNQYTEDALEATRLAVEASGEDGPAILGHGDICHPNDQAYLPIFLEATACGPCSMRHAHAAGTPSLLSEVPPRARPWPEARRPDRVRSAGDTGDRHAEVRRGALRETGAGRAGRGGTGRPGHPLPDQHAGPWSALGP